MRMYVLYISKKLEERMLSVFTTKEFEKIEVVTLNITQCTMEVYNGSVT
jgi:hypothetical protein